MLVGSSWKNHWRHIRSSYLTCWHEADGKWKKKKVKLSEGINPFQALRNIQGKYGRPYHTKDRVAESCSLFVRTQGSPLGLAHHTLDEKRKKKTKKDVTLGGMSDDHSCNLVGSLLCRTPWFPSPALTTLDVSLQIFSCFSTSLVPSL